MTTCAWNGDINQPWTKATAGLSNFSLCSVKFPPSLPLSPSFCLLTECDRGLAGSSGSSFTLINVSSSSERDRAPYILFHAAPPLIPVLHPFIISPSLSVSLFLSPPHLRAQLSSFLQQLAISPPALCLMSTQAYRLYRIIIQTLSFLPSFFPSFLPLAPSSLPPPPTSLLLSHPSTPYFLSFAHPPLYAITSVINHILWLQAGLIIMFRMLKYK